MKTTAWVIYFMGAAENKPNLCWWGKLGQGMFFETKEGAQKALDREFTDWRTLHNKPFFKVVSCQAEIVE